MENAYGVGVKNRYELFYDEDVDPLEIIRLQEEEKMKRKTDRTQKDKSKSSKFSASLPASKSANNMKETSQEEQLKTIDSELAVSTKPPRRFPERGRSNRFFSDAKSFDTRQTFRPREEHQSFSLDNRERGSDTRRARGGGFRGRGRRGRGNYPNFDNHPPRREFDNYNDSEKIDIQSPDKDSTTGNWNEEKPDFSYHQKEKYTPWMDEVQAETTIETVIAENIDSKENLPVTEDHVEESSKEMTLDEWKQQQQTKRAVPKYNLRKPGEGEDGNQWKKGYMLKKEKPVNPDEEEEDEIDEEEYARRGRQRQLVDIPINFSDSRRGRGRARGSRGIGQRGGAIARGKYSIPQDRREYFEGSNFSRNYRGTGETRVNKPGQQLALRFNDIDFPSLVA